MRVFFRYIYLCEGQTHELLPEKCTHRGGAGISKMVRPLHIKDDSCMCKEVGGGGRSTTGNVQIRGGSRGGGGWWGAHAPPFGTEPARNAEVCYALSARSYFDAVHISV